jgi:hypothetical protein
VEYVSNEPSQIQTEFLSLRTLPCSNVVEVHEFVQRLELDLKKKTNPALFKVNGSNYFLTYFIPVPPIATYWTSKSPILFLLVTLI